MVDCSKCGKKLGFLSSKNKLDNGSVLCSSCFDELQKEQREKDKKVMIDYIKKYIVGKDDETISYILGCHKISNVNELFDDDSLQRVIENYQNLLSQAEYSNKSGMSSYDIDDIIETKKMCEKILVFLNDLEKIYKIFNKKGIETNYREILSFFAEIIEEKQEREIYNPILIPAYKRIVKRLGKDISVEGVIKEFMRIPLKITYNFDLISKLLDKFELDYDKDEVEELIEEVQEEIGLEEFEEDLGSTQNIEIGDFEKLTGYEFEGYLKGLFDLLGYTVIETSLSGDQGADLIASKDGQKTVVQAKKYSGKVANKAIQEISAAQRHYKADKAIVVTNSSFTKSAIDLALSNDVELWDGKKLKDIIRELRSKKKEKHLEAQKAMTLNFKDGEKFVKINIPCPFCEENFDYDLEIGKNSFETSCPNCGSEIASKVNVKSTSRTWSCEFCGKEFDTKEKAEKHEKTCRSRKK